MGFQVKAIDNEQEELQFLGFFGIFKESLKIFLTWSNIFLQITLAFILPRSIFFLADNWISKLFFSKIHHDLSTLPNNQVGYPTNNNNNNTNYISSEIATLWLINVLYFIIAIVLSLFAISAVVYTVACIYSGKTVTFRKVISVVPKVWKRLIITFLCNFCIIVAYIVIVTLFTLIWGMIIVFSFKPKNAQIGMIILMSIMMILFMVGLFYMAIVWQLANVISVMEKNCGFKALKKSKELVKGKMGTALGISLVIGLCEYLIHEIIKKVAGVGMLGKITFGIPSVMLWAVFTLLTLVAHTIFYLVCKSFHHETIDKSLLADHLDVYLGDEYAPLNTEESIQLQHLHV